MDFVYCLALLFAVMLLSLLGGRRQLMVDVERGKVKLYFLMIILLAASLPAMFYMNDLFTCYVFLEILCLASCAIIMLHYAKETKAAAAGYLTLSLCGSGLFLLGICILYAVTGQLTMAGIFQRVHELTMAGISGDVPASAQTGSYAFPLEMAIMLLVVGLGAKCALFPFHAWLPDALGNATSATGAVLSGTVSGGCLLLLFRIIFRAIGVDVFSNLKACNVLFVLGGCAMVASPVMGLMEKDIKRRTAYCLIGQIGMVSLAIGIGTTEGFVAAFCQIIAIVITGPLVLEAVGGLMTVSYGSRKLTVLRGAGRRNPLAGVAFTIGALSMIGMPLLGGFMSRYYLVIAGMEAGSKMIPSMVLLVISTILMAMCCLPVAMVIFSKEGGTGVLQAGIPQNASGNRSRKNPPGFVIAMVVFMILQILMGCCFAPVISWVGRLLM